MAQRRKQVEAQAASAILESQVEETQTHDEDTDPEDAKRPSFDLSSASNAQGSIVLDDKGRLTAVPSNWTRTFRRLKRSQFAENALYFEYLITLEEVKIQRINDRIEELRELAEESRTGVDPTKKAMRKLAKIAKVAQALRAQLEAEGVDLSELEL